MCREVDDSGVLACSPMRRLAALWQVILAATTLIALAAPAQAYEIGLPPSDPHESYVAVRTGLGPNESKFIRTRFDREEESYVLSTFHGTGNPHGVAHSSARVSEARFGDIYLNPDLHASVSGEAKSIGEFGNISGSIDAAANVSFRDIIIIKKLPDADEDPGGFPHGGYPFDIDYSINGTMVGMGDASSASRAWADVVVNLAIYDLDRPGNAVGEGVGFSTLPRGERPEETTIAGVNGDVSKELTLTWIVKEGSRLVIEGSIDMLGTATGGDPLGAIFNADFSNSLRFGGIRIYTDDTRTTELTGYTIESAFGFDYRVNVVPEPASLAQLAIAGVLFGTLRRKCPTAAAS